MTKNSKRAATKNPRIKRKRLFLQEKPLLQRRKLSNSGGLRIGRWVSPSRFYTLVELGLLLTGC